MRKIPTLFVRQRDGFYHYVTPEVTPGCEWVIEGEGVATRKFDGTCVMIDENRNGWARREVKPGKEPPDIWFEVDFDETTGKRVGWEPIENSSFVKFFDEAIVAGDWRHEPGTFELCGPKINGNPEGFPEHALVRHGSIQFAWAPRTFDDLARFLRDRPQLEGIVWHHPDGRMAKLKRRDFPK